MKWLLISTNPAPHVPGTDHPNGAGWNVGDVFARIGTEQVIREVDPSAEFDILNMDSHASITTERPFDRCVLAGRPLFWKGCETHPLWTHVINGWPGRDPRKICAFGVGDCYVLPRDDAHIHARLADLKSKVWGTSLRFAFDTDDARLSVCPAAWVLLDREEKPTRKLANVMWWGGHYVDFDRRDATLFHQMRDLIGEVLLGAGFDFVAHTKDEVTIARDIGWHSDRIIFADTIEPYLEAYASASHYFGNRMHGATILAGRMAWSMAVGYDSRLRMCERVGCEAKKPSQLSLQGVIEFAEREQPTRGIEHRIWAIRGERAKAVRMMEEFAK